jgi:hypothetical protein
MSIVKNRLFDLPPEILTKVYEFEGGQYYKDIMKCVVLPRMIQECWKRWEKRVILPYKTRMKKYKSLVYDREHAVSRKDVYAYWRMKDQYKMMSVFIEFVKHRYWNRMYTCPTDTLSFSIHLLNHNELMDFGKFARDIDYYGEFDIFWRRTKEFPGVEYLDGVIIDTSVFRAYYNEHKIGNITLYESRRDASSGHYYRLLYQSKKWNMVVIKFQYVEWD